MTKSKSILRREQIIKHDQLTLFLKVFGFALDNYDQAKKADETFPPKEALTRIWNNFSAERNKLKLPKPLTVVFADDTQEHVATDDPAEGDYWENDMDQRFHRDDGSGWNPVL